MSTFDPRNAEVINTSRGVSIGIQIFIFTFLGLLGIIFTCGLIRLCMRPIKKNPEDDTEAQSKQTSISSISSKTTLVDPNIESDDSWKTVSFTVPASAFAHNNQNANDGASGIRSS